MRKNRRFCLQVFSGDTVENVFSDVATSQKTWQRYRKFLIKTNFRHLLHRLLSFVFLFGQAVQDCKKIINNLNFLAILKNEQLVSSVPKYNYSFFKTKNLFYSRNNLPNLRFTYGQLQSPVHLHITHASPPCCVTFGLVRINTGQSADRYQ